MRLIDNLLTFLLANRHDHHAVRAYPIHEDERATDAADVRVGGIRSIEHQVRCRNGTRNATVFVDALIVACIVATGAGLHVAAHVIGHRADITTVAAVLGIAIPVVIFLGASPRPVRLSGSKCPPARRIAVPHEQCRRDDRCDRSVAGISLAASLVILMLAPTVTVIGYAKLGYSHAAEALSN